jgi:type IV fimbrial biogenesis protein FimT
MRRNCADPLPSKRGFTLIELMIVLVILGALIAAATPGFTKWIANTKVRTTAESIQNALMQAKSEAISTNRKVQFVLTTAEPIATSVPATGTNTGRNWIIQAVAQGGTTFDQFIQGRSLGDGGNQVLINSGSAATGCTRQATIVFTGLGIVSPVPAGMLCIDVSSTSSDRPLRITVSRGGAIRMCDPALSISTYTMGC